MTKKHFEALAAALADTRPSDEYTDQMARWALIRNHIAAFCAETNPRFDVERFKEATQV